LSERFFASHDFSQAEGNALLDQELIFQFPNVFYGQSLQALLLCFIATGDNEPLKSELIDDL
jgi:hypothetical protein